MKRASKRLLIPDAPSYLYSANLKDMSKLTDLTGKSFGTLTVISRVFKGDGKVHWNCQCTCGFIFSTRQDQLKQENNKYCRCDKRQRERIMHGQSKHKLYAVWEAIVGRCYNLNSPVYKYYGARGIEMSDEWRNDASVFINWCLDNGWREGLQIDRADNNRGYFPDNCRFVTAKQNMRNTRMNRFHFYKGEEKTIGEWCEIFNLHAGTIRGRIVSQGMSLAEAIEKPIPKKRPYRKKINPNQ